jgi:hypothetical protein
MEKKKFYSFDEINRELEILKIEKELSYRRLVKSIDNTKESIFPTDNGEHKFFGISATNISSIIETTQKISSGPIGTIAKLAIPFAINWWINRKKKSGN